MSSGSARSSNPTRLPLVSVGLAAHDGERFIAATIASLLDQDYPNLEVLISDNASSDQTLEICASFAKRDARVRVQAQVVNLGAAANFASVLSSARGEYFMWAADHDLWAPTFVSRCLAELEDDPGAVLAYPQTTLIDEQDRPLELMDDELDLSQPKALDRYLQLIWNLQICNSVYGLIRTGAARLTGGPKPVIGADHLILAELVLQGRFIRIDEPLFLRRTNRPSETPAEEQARRLLEIGPPTHAQGTAEVSFRRLRDYHLRAVLRSSLPLRDRSVALAATVLCFRKRFSVRSFPAVLVGPLLENRLARRVVPRAFGSSTGDAT